MVLCYNNRELMQQMDPSGLMGQPRSEASAYLPRKKNGRLSGGSRSLKRRKS